MAVRREYSCNVCKESIKNDPFSGFGGIGLYWMSGGWTKKNWAEVENHICIKCLSSIQQIPKMCGQGFECTGGVKCSSDHK